MPEYILTTLNLIGVVAAVIAATISFILLRSDRIKDLSRLKALNQHLNFIKESARGHESQLKNGKKPLPSWPVANFDLNYYLTNIKYKIRKEYFICCRKSTKDLKEDLIFIHEKISNINYLWDLIVKKEKDKTDLVSSTYYSDLLKRIEQAQREIKDIVRIL